MRKMIFVLFLVGCFQTNAQGVIGKWKTIDDKTKEAKSIVEIFEKNEKIYGKVIEIFNPEKRHAKCSKCDGADKNKPILGLQVIRELEKDGDEYTNGKIVDPETGHVYKCNIKLLDKDKLEVRGYIGMSFIGRSQTWIRKK